MRLNADQEDVLREVVNIGIGRAAATLSDLIGTRIELSVPRLSVVDVREAGEEWRPRADDHEVLVVQDFAGSCSGRSALVLPNASAIRLALLLGEVAAPTDELDLELSGILTEVGNIMLNAVLGSLANQIETRLIYSVPRFEPDPTADLLGEGDDRLEVALIAEAQFRVREACVTGDLLLLLDEGGVESILEALGAITP